MTNGEHANADTKIKVKISTTSPIWPLVRQTPGQKGVWGNCQFYINDNTKDCDWWIIFKSILDLLQNTASLFGTN